LNDYSRLGTNFQVAIVKRTLPLAAGLKLSVPVSGY
jgi:hypothetical protein